MKKLLLFILVITTSFTTMAQLVGGTTYPINGTDNGTTSFASLRSAITYLQTNGVTGSGQVILEFTAPYNVSDVDLPAVGATKITIPAISGTSATLGITLRPAAGVTVNLSANVDGAGIIDLEGVSYLTIDGRPGGVGIVRALTIENLSTTVNGGTAAVRFLNDANRNVVNYITLKSATTNSAGAAATVLFATSTGSLGNSKNTISNNALSASTGSLRSSYQIISNGSITAPNDANVVVNNEVSNFSFRAIYLVAAGLGNDWVISDNSIFSPISVNGGSSYAICVFGTAAGHTIANNYIGGQAPQCGGNAMTTAGFFGIYLSSSPTLATSTVQKNTIANISSNYTSAVTANTTVQALIYVNGNVDVLGNKIGSQTTNDNIILSTSTTSAFALFASPIYIIGSGTVNVKNNLVGGITYNPTGTAAQGYYARIIQVASSTLTSLNIENNTLGGVLSGSIKNTGTARPVFLQAIYNLNSGNILDNNIRNMSNSTNASMAGIFFSGNFNANVIGNKIDHLANTGGGTATTLTGITVAGTTTGTSIASNIISNLTTNGINTGNGSASVLTAISLSTAGSTITVTDNSIYNLDCTGTGDTHVIGIGSFGGRLIARNKIYNLTNLNATTAGSVKAIVLRGPDQFNVNNNIISLTNVDGNAAVYGVESNSATALANIYYNTIQVSGTATGANNSAAIFRSVATPMDIKNNILFNTRGGGTGVNTLFYATETVAAWNSDHNLYVSPAGFTTVSLWGGTSYNLTDWKTFRTSDDVNAASYTASTLDPALFFENSSSPYFMAVKSTFDAYFKNKGAVLSVTQDFVNNNRSVTTPSLGAYEANEITLLPVDISAFTAKLHNNKVLLQWRVGTEKNVNRYEIERSVNGAAFEKIADITATGSLNYSNVDANPLAGVNYYRLKTVDNDASTVYFGEVKTVKIAELIDNSFAIYPNPIMGNNVNVVLANHPSGSYTYQVVSMTGRVVQKGSISHTGNSNHTLNLNSLIAKGTYILSISKGKEVSQSKFIKN